MKNYPKNPEEAYNYPLAIVEYSTTTKSWLVINYKENAKSAWEHFLQDIKARGKRGYLLNFGLILGEC